VPSILDQLLLDVVSLCESPPKDPQNQLETTEEENEEEALGDTKSHTLAEYEKVDAISTAKLSSEVAMATTTVTH